MIARSTLIALVVASASFIQQIDSTIILTSLPQMGLSLGASPVELGAAVTTYALSLAVFMPISAWLADRYGASNVFRLAIIVFTIGSIACGLSASMTELTIARFFQGMGGAIMTPVGRLLVLRGSKKSEFVASMAWLQMAAQIGPLVGLPVGGFIATYFSWRWNFFINVPLGLIGIVLVGLFIRDEMNIATQPFDFPGFALSGGALFCTIHALNLLGGSGNPEFGAGFMAAGLALGLLALRHAKRSEHPLLDLSLLQQQTFSINVLAGSLFRFGVDAIPFLLPLLFQLKFGMSPLNSGLLSLASAIGSLTMKAVATPIITRFGFRRVLVVNGLISCATILVCALYTEATSIAWIFATLTVGGFFRSLQFVALNTIAYAQVQPAQMSAATSLASMSQQLSNAVGTALAVLVLHVELGLRGASTLAIIDFQLAFVAMACVALTALPSFLRLPQSAGSELISRRTVQAQP